MTDKCKWVADKGKGVEIGMLIATGIIAGIAIYQSYILQSQHETSQRAWVTALSPIAYPENGPITKIVVSLRNSGQTPAVNTKLDLIANFTDEKGNNNSDLFDYQYNVTGPLPDGPSYRLPGMSIEFPTEAPRTTPENSSQPNNKNGKSTVDHPPIGLSLESFATVGPSDSIENVIILKQPIPLTIFTRKDPGKAELIVRGSVKYRDIFNEQHCTLFCFKFSGVGNSFIACRNGHEIFDPAPPYRKCEIKETGQLSVSATLGPSGN